MKRYADIAIAALICLVSLSASLAAIAAIRNEDSLLAASLINIREGNAHYVVTSHGKCAGTIETGFSRRRSAQLSGRMQLEIMLGRNSSPVDLSYSCYFNPLLQLQKADLRFTAQQTDIALEINGVNPLQLNLRAVSGARRWQKSMNLPGPLTLREEKDRRPGKIFSVQYGTAANAQSSRLFETLRPLTGLLGLEIGEKADCRQEPGRIDLGPLWEKLSENPLLRDIVNDQKEGLK